MKLSLSLALLIVISSFSPAVGDDLPMITIKGEKFMADGKEFKIWGFNQGSGLNLTDEELQQQADQLAFLGVNMLRLHTIDWTYWGEIGPDGKACSTGIRPCGLDLKSTRGIINVDKFYRFLDKMREKKIYVAITLSVCSHFGLDDVKILKTTPEDEKAWVEAIDKLNRQINSDSNAIQIYKSLPTIDERASLLQREWATNLLTLKNPKTGVQLAKDPQLALLNTVNENSCWGSFYRNPFFRALPPYFMNKFLAKWNAYLLKKYGSDEKLAAAWTQKDKKGLLPDESLAKGTVKALPIDPYACANEKEKKELTPAAFSEARRKDFVTFTFELDAALQRDMLKCFRAAGWDRPALYCDNAIGIDSEMGFLWLKSGLMPYIEEHPYDEANINLYTWDTIKLCVYFGSSYLGPKGAVDRPIWGSEIREGSWLSAMRIPFPLFAAVYHSLQGRDGLTWHVWPMNHGVGFVEPTTESTPQVYHCNLDVPWQFSYRAAGRLFKSCEIKPLAKSDPALEAFAQWKANFKNGQVYRIHGAGRGILKVTTPHFRAVTTLAAQKVDFPDLVINLTTNEYNTVYVEKLSPTQYEVTAIGTTGGMDPKGKPFDPMLFVQGDVRFKGRTIDRIEHVDFRGRVVKTVAAKGSVMPFTPGVRLYRVTLK